MIDPIDGQHVQSLTDVCGWTFFACMNSGFVTQYLGLEIERSKSSRRIAHLWPAHADTGNLFGPGRDGVEHLQRIFNRSAAGDADDISSADAGRRVCVADSAKYAAHDGIERHASLRKAL